MPKEIPENFEPNDEHLSDVGAEWEALNKVSKESNEAAQDIDAESQSEALIAEAIRGELKEMLMLFSDRLLMMPDSHPEKRLLSNVTEALGLLLTPKHLRSDLSRMKLASQPLEAAHKEVEERYRRLAGLPDER